MIDARYKETNKMLQSADLMHWSTLVLIKYDPIFSLMNCLSRGRVQKYLAIEVVSFATFLWHSLKIKELVKEVKEYLKIDEIKITQENN